MKVLNYIYITAGVVLILVNIIIFITFKNIRLNIMAGFSSGLIVGIYPFFTWQIMARFFLDAKKKRRRYLAIILPLKYGILLLIFYLIFSTGFVNIPAFLCGMLSISVLILIVLVILTPTKNDNK